ncbi:MAG TPA: signal peptide peptidase SppA [Steroidobacteraceae bacterium]|nr:signal peptide peptidase SppA [Steroidobacteraceae bacterium]
MNLLRSILYGLWRGLDVLRRFLHLLVLLVIFGFVIGALRGSVPTVPSKAALVVAPEGELVEQTTGDPFERAIEEARGTGHAETLLWDLTDAIRSAAKDKRIQVLAIDLEKLDGGGQPSLEELAKAIREFRATGKKVISYGNEMTQERYYIAAQADEIYLDPMGFVLIDGYARYRMFFKEALDKLGVDINVFRVGAYKSAVEEYTRTDMSAEDKQESSVYLNALWTTYQEAMTRARKLPADALSKYVNTLAKTVPAANGNAAQVALDAGLVTGIKSRPDVEKRIIDLVGEDDSTGSFKQVSTTDYVRIAHAEMKARADGKPRVGVIVAAGEILDGDQPAGTVGGDSTARLIRQARLDRNIKAVVLRVNSPGGSVMASEEIYRELVAMRAAGKPVVVSMSTLAASGGYYISAPADEIWASPATLTGSIGIFAVIPTVDKTLGKVGVTVDGVGTTPLSGQLRIDRPMSEESRALLQSQINRGYDEFLARVSTGRKKTRDEIDAIAQGRVWAGGDAKRLGLVDRLGSFDDAVHSAARRAKLTDYELEFVEPELSWAQELVLQLKGSAVKVLLKAGVDDKTTALVRVAHRFDPLTREVERLSRFTEPNKIYAYCFCYAQ